MMSLQEMKQFVGLIIMVFSAIIIIMYVVLSIKEKMKELKRAKKRKHRAAKRTTINKLINYDEFMKANNITYTHLCERKEIIKNLDCIFSSVIVR